MTKIENFLVDYILSPLLALIFVITIFSWTLFVGLIIWPITRISYFLHKVSNKKLRKEEFLG